MLVLVWQPDYDPEAILASLSCDQTHWISVQQLFSR